MALRHLGARAINFVLVMGQMARLFKRIVLVSVHSSTYTLPVRNVIYRQIIVTGVESIPLILAIALILGFAFSLQVFLFSESLGFGVNGGMAINLILARDAVPYLVNFSLIIRSVSAMRAELELMKSQGDMRLLESLGIDLLGYVCVPRILALCVSAMGLTLLFLTSMMLTLYIAAVSVGAVLPSIDSFLLLILEQLRPIDGIFLVLRTVLPAFVMGMICSFVIYEKPVISSEIPVNIRRVLSYSFLSLFIISGLLSLISLVLS